MGLKREVPKLWNGKKAKYSVRLKSDRKGEKETACNMEWEH